LNAVNAVNTPNNAIIKKENLIGPNTDSNKIAEIISTLLTESILSDFKNDDSNANQSNGQPGNPISNTNTNPNQSNGQPGNPISNTNLTPNTSIVKNEKQEDRTEKDVTHMMKRIMGMSKPTAYDATILLEDIKRKNPNGEFPNDDYKNLYDTLYKELSKIRKPDDIGWHETKVQWSPVVIYMDTYKDNKGATIETLKLLKGTVDTTTRSGSNTNNVSSAVALAVASSSAPSVGVSSSAPSVVVPSPAPSVELNKIFTDKRNQKDLLQLWNVVRFHNPFSTQMGAVYTNVNKITDGIKSTIKNLLNNREQIPDDFKILLEAIQTAIKEQRDLYFLGASTLKNPLIFSYCDEIVKTKGFLGLVGNNILFNLSQNLPHIIFNSTKRTNSYQDGRLPIWDGVLFYKGAWGKIDPKQNSKILETFVNEIIKYHPAVVAMNRATGTRRRRDGGYNKTRKNQPLK